MRKPLSMKRLHMLAANFIISLGSPNGKFIKDEVEYSEHIIHPIIMDFIKYIWEHKEDENLYDVYSGLKKK